VVELAIFFVLAWLENYKDNRPQRLQSKALLQLLMGLNELMSSLISVN
jgi:hypothetical protein